MPKSRLPAGIIPDPGVLILQGRHPVMWKSCLPYAGAVLWLLGAAVQATAAGDQYQEWGTASWYGEGFQGLQTASGEIFDLNQLTAAHRELPFGAQVTVINLRTGASVAVVINDRGPCIAGRDIDLSEAAARALGIIEDGVAPVLIEADLQQLANVQRTQTRTSVGC
jgi:rare lipoprotein A (peptidoglycan hydrolase)